MELKQIKYFLALSKTLNFTEAAELNNVSQPALTKAIRRLEEEVGGPLIHRDGKHTRLSELGRKVLSQFEAIRDSEERVRKLAASHLVEGETTIRLGVVDTLGPLRFGHLLNSFLENNPAVQIALHSVAATSADEQILSGMLDACLCVNADTPNEKIRRTVLYKEQLFAAMAQDHPLAQRPSITLDDLMEHPYLDRLSCEFRPPFLEKMRRLGYRLQPIVESQREDWIQQLVKTGKGVTTLPQYSEVMPGLVLRAIADLNLGRTVSMTSVLGSTGNSAIRSLEKLATNSDWSSLQPLGAAQP